MTRKATKTLEESGLKNVRFEEDPRGTFSIVSGGRSGTSPITIGQVNAGDTIKVTCVFNAQAAAGGGFYYNIQQIDGTAKLSTGSGVVTLNGWSGTSRIDFFQATESGDASFEVDFVKNDLNGEGVVNSFMLIVENLGA
jgi:hypothetical protein